MDTPVVSPIGGVGVYKNAKFSRLYNNPMFDYMSEMMPQNIKEAFKWCELVFHNAPVIANSIRKLVNYPVTSFSFDDPSEKVRDLTKELVEKIHLKSALLDLGTDRYVYGNAFRSIYFPFKRFLRCPHCEQLTSIENAKYTIRKKTFQLTCKCGFRGQADIEDIYTDDITKIKIVRWDPKQIELAQNPITGETQYYYALPKSFVSAVRRGDITVLKDSPKLFIDAALEGKNIVMGGNFFHSKTTSLAGYASGWGISPLIPTLKTYMHTAVLRKASEAIGLEHIVPQRIVFPQTNGSSDPSIMGSMQRWKDEINKAFDRWRQDPNYIMTAPFPTGVTNIGSQGRALSPIEEIKDGRQEMAMALDIPPNILMGDATMQTSAVGLRILENQLTPTTESLQDFSNWVIDMINAHMEKQYCRVGLVPFRLADDVMNKQLIMQALGTAVSKSTFQEALNLDPDTERQRLMQEALADHEAQTDMDAEITQREQNMASQAQADAQAMTSGQIPQYNQQKMIAMAQQQAQELMSVPYEQRKSILAQLQNEDYIMWALVTKQLEMFHREANEQGAM